MPVTQVHSGLSPPATPSAGPSGTRARPQSALPRKTARSTRGENSQRPPLVIVFPAGPSSPALDPIAAGRQHLLGGAHALIERLLEEGDAGQVRVGEVDAAERVGGGAPGGAPDEAGARADHA